MAEPTVANFKAALSACDDAIEAGDLAEARTQHALALTRRAGLLASASVEGVSVARESAATLEGIGRAIEQLAEKSSDRLFEIRSRMVP